jgi:hypothetical protein
MSSPSQFGRYESWNTGQLRMSWKVVTKGAGKYRH